MKHEDIVILKLIKDLLQDKEIKSLDKLLSPNILQNINFSQSSQSPFEHSEELVKLQEENKLLQERLNSQSDMTEMSIKHLMNELEEMKRRFEGNAHNAVSLINQQLDKEEGNIQSIKNYLNQELNKVKQEKENIEREKQQILETKNRLEQELDSLKYRGTQKSKGINNLGFTQMSQSEAFGDWSFLKKTIFSNEQKLSRHFNQFYTSTSNILTDNFYWVGERMGLVYLAIINCGNNGNKSKSTAILINSWLNHLIFETRVSFDIEQVIGKLNMKMAEIYSQQERKFSQQVSLGLCVIDNLNETLYFTGLGSDLYIQQRSGLEEIKGQKIFLGKNSNSSQSLGKVNFPLYRGSSFFMSSFKDESMKTQVVKYLSDNKHLGLLEQGNRLNDLSQSNGNKDFIILGFKI